MVQNLIFSENVSVVEWFPMKKAFLYLTPVILLGLLTWYSFKTDPIMRPPALSKDAFDRSIGIESLGKKFVLHRVLDRKIRTKAREFISQRKSEFVPGKASSIPHIIHQIWTSEDPLPDQFAAAARLVQQQHPDFTYVLWKPKEYEPILQEIVGPSYESIPLPIQRDLAAAAVLWRLGGIVVDVQAECVQPATHLLSLGDCLLGFDPPQASAKHGRRLFLSPAVMAATPSHPLMMAYLAEMLRRIKNNEAYDIEWISRDALTTVASKTSINDRVLFLGPTYFCPINRKHIRHFREILEGERKRSMIKKALHSLHLISIPPYSDIARETVFVHMEGGREKEQKF
jgi:mannosyltransferase OCH1-like enzyme